MNRLKSLSSIAIAAGFVLAPMTAGASPTPSPSLDTVLAAPPSIDFNELTTSPLHGRFTAHDWASLTSNSSAAAQTESTLNRDGFVEGYGNTWAQASSGHALIEAVMAFSGGRGAQETLVAMEKGDKSDASYKNADTVSGIATYYGAHFVDNSNQVIEDFFGFVKGNDVFGIAFVSSKDDVLNAATMQAQSQYTSAPDSTIPRSQWPENATTRSSFPIGVFAFGVAVVVLVTGLVAFLALRRRPPAMVGAYAMAGVPGTAVPEAVTLPGGTQMSPDGSYWWDGQSWRDATHDIPPDAQRSDDGAYWWDGRSWRPMPVAAPAPPEEPKQPPPPWLGQ